MCDKNFIFLSVAKKQMFHSSVDDRVPGFRKFADYRLASGDVDFQSFDNDLSDLRDAGFTEICSPHFMKVNLYYMKESGKYYSTGELLINRAEATQNPTKSWYDTVERVRAMHSAKSLPGLVDGAQFDVFLSCEEHPSYFPVLIK